MCVVYGLYIYFVLLFIGILLQPRDIRQSWTGRVLGAVPSAAVMGARRIFLVVTLKTHVFTVTTNAQNTLQHFQGRASTIKTFHFFRKWRLCSSKGGGLCHGTNGTMASPSQDIRVHCITVLLWRIKLCAVFFWTTL